MRRTIFDGFSLVSRPRRIAIVDLMAGVAWSALGMALSTLVARSELKPDERSAYGLITLIALLSLCCQWPLSGMRAGHATSWASVMPGAVAVFLATVTITCLAMLSLALPEGAALVLIMMLILVMYLTTWD
jgi:hypothetical protein